MFSLDNLWFSI